MIGFSNGFSMNTVIYNFYDVVILYMVTCHLFVKASGSNYKKVMIAKSVSKWLSERCEIHLNNIHDIFEGSINIIQVVNFG